MTNTVIQCASVYPSVRLPAHKKFSNFNEIWYVGRGL